jgi:hypothetical protein
MKTKIVIIISTAVALFISQCSNSPTEINQQIDNEARSFENLSSDVLIDLPGSIALSPSPLKLSKTVSSPSQAYTIYDGIRTYIGFANYLVNNDDFGVRTMIGFWRDTLNWRYIREVGSLTGTEGNFTWYASYDSTVELAYKLTVTKNNGVSNLVILKIDFNGRALLSKGRIYYNIGEAEDSQNDSLQIEVSFDRQIGGSMLHVGVTGCKMEKPDDPRNLDLSIHKKGGIIHISGSSFHPGIDSLITGVTGHCYTFTGVTDPVANKSVIKLGLPPSNYNNNDNAIFTTYGISEMWTSALIANDILTLPDTVKSLIATSYAKSMSLEAIYLKILTDGNLSILVPASTINSMTVEQFKQFLILNGSISNPELRAVINEMLWIAELTQPVYFYEKGYFGNGTTIPAGFAYLSEVKNVLEPLIPMETATMVINP